MKRTKFIAQKTLSSFFTLMLLLIFVTACDQDEEEIAPSDNPDNIVQILENFDREVEDFDESENARFRKFRIPTFATLISALDYTGLLKTVVDNKLTVFAPTDGAFAKIGINFLNVRQIDKDALTNILLYHVLGGKVFANDLSNCYQQTLNEDYLNIIKKGRRILVEGTNNRKPAKLLLANIHALNGVLHIVNEVLLPPDATIAEIAQEAGSFNKLVEFLTVTGLVEAVNEPNDPNVTVFAPTDEAFHKVLSSLNEAQLQIINDNLSDILLHHVVAGKVFSCNLSDGLMVETLLGNNKITVDLHSFQIFSSSGNGVPLIVKALDIQANNGVVHAIDGVLIPKAVADMLQAAM